MPIAAIQFKRLIDFIKYCLVGTSSTIIDVGLIYMFVEYGHLPILTAATLSFILSAINGYTLNRIWTFKSTKKTYKTEFAKFLMVATIGLGINIISMEILTHRLQLWYIFSKILSSGIVLSWSFLANSKWTFKPEKP